MVSVCKQANHIKTVTLVTVENAEECHIKIEFQH